MGNQDLVEQPGLLSNPPQARKSRPVDGVRAERLHVLAQLALDQPLGDLLLVPLVGPLCRALARGGQLSLRNIG